MVLTIYCDNLQTAGVVIKDEDKLFTGLRHVNVHQNRLRQEVANGRISVQWKSTNLMPTDGITKILVRQNCNGASNERKLLCIVMSVVIALYRATRIVCLHEVAMILISVECAHQDKEEP
jgi:hypothetical protein